jgi:hypothetical protein
MGKNMKDKLLFSFVIVFSVFGTAGIASATTIDYALLTEGASIESVSSKYLEEYQIAQDNLLRPTKEPWLHNGETWFIFDENDDDQTIVVNLGVDRLLDRVGATFKPQGGDRPVWDFFGISISRDNISYTMVGSLGTKGDNIIDVHDVQASPYYFDLSTATMAHYVKFEFGAHNPDGSGSRVLDLYAESAPVPEPATMCLFGIGLLGIAGVRRKKK